MKEAETEREGWERRKKAREKEEGEGERRS